MKEKRRKDANVELILLELTPENRDRVFSAPELAKKLEQVLGDKKEEIEEAFEKLKDDVSSMIGEELAEISFRSMSYSSFYEAVRREVQNDTMRMGLTNLLRDGTEFTSENLVKLISEQMIEEEFEKVSSVMRARAIGAAMFTFS